MERCRVPVGRVRRDRCGRARRRMNILFVSQEYPPETGWGGIGSYVSIIAPALAARGHEVHVLSCVEGQPVGDRFERGVHLHRRGQMRVRGLGRALRSHEAASRLKGAISSFLEARRLGVGFDAVEIPDWQAEGMGFAALGKWPIVAQLHTPVGVITRTNGRRMDRSARMSDRTERFAVRRSHVVTSPSELLVRELRKENWLGAQDAQIIRCPIDVDRWSDVSSAEHTDPVILVVGRVEPRKAQEVVVEAASRLVGDGEDVRLLFVGRSNGVRAGIPYREWVARRAAELGVQAEFLDEIPRDELAAVYERARVVAVPSRFDNFAVVAIEAMASGRPVVCSDMVGAAEVIKETEAGQVVPAGDPGALAGALVPYLRDPSFAAQAGSAARAVVAQTCAPDEIARQRESVYELAIARHGENRAREARWFPHAARVVGRVAPAWRRAKAIDTALVPWHHFYLRTAELLLRLIWQHPSFRGRHDLSGVSILDLATTPDVSIAFAEMGAIVTCLDIDGGELGKARRLADRLGVSERVRLVQADAFRVPFRLRSFDLVWNSSFIEHFDDPVGIVRTMNELTREGGAVCVLTPAPNNLHSAVVRERLRRSSDGYYWDRIGRERSLSAPDLRRILEQAGVRVLASLTGDLRRSLLDDSLVLPVLHRSSTRRVLFEAMNALDWVDEAFPPAHRIGFTAGAIGISEIMERSVPE